VARATRCESICMSVAVATDAAACEAVRPSRKIMKAANTRKVSSSTPSTWNCWTMGRLPMNGILRGIRTSELAVRSCSMIDTEASGS
jgi:hypothetical protein